MSPDEVFIGRLQSQIGGMVFQILQMQLEIERLTAELASRPAKKAAKAE